MELSSDLISQFVKSTNDSGTKQNEVIVHGVIVTDGDRKYVKLDGSSELAPIESTVEINAGDRVIVAVKNHSAMVTGNTDDPAIGTRTANGMKASIQNLGDQLKFEVSNEEGSLASKITMVANRIDSEVLDKETGLASVITQLSDRLEFEVSDEEGSLASKITQTTESIETLVQNDEEFSQFKQTVEGWEFVDENGSIKIENGTIKWDYLDEDAKQEVIDAQTVAANASTVAGAASTAASNAYTYALSASNTVSGWVFPGTTQINGSMIATGTVCASSIQAGTVGLYDSNGKLAGFLYLDGASSYEGRALRITSGALQLTSQYGDINIMRAVAGSTQPFITLHNTSVTHYGTSIGGGPIAPATNGTYSCGLPSFTWSAVYTDTCTGTTSDRNKKNSIEELPEKYITMFDKLTPKRFKMNNGTSDRYHVGYIAQEVEEAMNAAGIDSQEFGGFVRDVDEDGNNVYMLRYGEFDAIRDAKIKQLEAKNQELESRLEKLEKLLLQQ